MTGQDAIGVARQSIEHFNEGNWDGYRATLAPNAVYDELGTGRRIQGPDEIIRVSQAWKQAFPDARGTITSTIASGDTVALEITWEGTQTGPLQAPTGTIPASGRRVRLPAVQVVKVEGGRARETRHYFNLLALLQQIGAAPQ